MEISPIIVSMKTASVSIVITFFLGLAAAYGVERIRSRKLQLVCDGILTLPLVLPPTVAGFFLLYIFGVKRPVGRFFLEFFEIKIAFSWQATVLAAVAISFPLMYRSARGALQQVDENLLYAGRTLGMSEWCIFWKVWFPNSPNPLANARIPPDKIPDIAFGNIAGETRTLPLAVYSAVSAGNMEEAYQYVWILVIISFLVVTGMNAVTHGFQKFSRR